MAFDPIPLKIPAGIVKSQSSVSVEGRYIDADKVRFWNGKSQKIGGWQKMISTALVGIVRGSLGWTTIGGIDKWTGGTATKLYAIDDMAQDITPLRESGNLTNPFTTTISSAVVLVADTGHGLDSGATAHFSGASAVGGITINGEYLVTVIDANSYNITHSAAATSSAGPGGGTVAYEYEINPGFADATAGTGYGAGPYGGGTYGTPRDPSDSIDLDMRYWSIQKYGNFLAILPSGGTLYLWDEPASDARAEAVSGAPSSARAMFVTPERFPTLLGTTTPMTVQWPDRDDITDWTPAEDNTANSRALQGGNKLMNGCALGSTLSLIWSDTSLFTHQYTGDDFVYDDQLVASNCGLIAPGAFALFSSIAFWMSPQGFFMYNGGVSSIPNVADIFSYVFDNLNTEQAGKCWAGYNPRFNEIWFGYPTGSSTEPDSYVAVSLNDYSWTIGTIDRSAMTFIPGAGRRTIMSGTDEYIYEHEIGVDADDAAMEAYIESGVVAIDGGRRESDIGGIEPDFERQTGDIDFELFFKDRPGTDEIERTAYTISEGDGMVDTNSSGRYAGYRITSDEVGGDFRLGTPKLEVEAAGTQR